MPPISPEQDHKIRQIIRHCGLQAAEMATQRFEITEKGPEDYVTTIDLALNQQLSAAFSTLFPEDGVITEEDPHSRQKIHSNYARFWCIDPLDGTEDLIRGNRDYAVMVGLLENYTPIAGWVYAPAYDQMYFGGVGWGVFHAVGDHPPVPLPLAPPVPAPSSLRCMIGHRDQQRYGTAIAQLIPEIQFRSLGSFGLKVLEVVMGRADFYLYFNQRVKVWDTTGPLALARTAGLVCSSLEGEPVRFTPNAIDPITLAHKQTILVSTPRLMAELRPKLVAAVHLPL